MVQLDSNGFCPLTAAARLGHVESVCALYRWGGEGILSTARARGCDPVPLLRAGGFKREEDAVYGSTSPRNSGISRRPYNVANSPPASCRSKGTDRNGVQSFLRAIDPEDAQEKLLSAGSGCSPHSAHTRCPLIATFPESSVLRCQSAPRLSGPSVSVQTKTTVYAERRPPTCARVIGCSSKEKPRRGLTSSQSWTPPNGPAAGKKETRREEKGAPCTVPRSRSPRRISLSRFVLGASCPNGRTMQSHQAPKDVTDSSSLKTCRLQGVSRVRSAAESPVPSADPRCIASAHEEVTQHKLPYVEGQLPLLLSLHYQQKQTRPAAKPQHAPPPAAGSNTRSSRPCLKAGMSAFLGSGQKHCNVDSWARATAADSGAVGAVARKDYHRRSSLDTPPSSEAQSSSSNGSSARVEAWKQTARRVRQTGQSMPLTSLTER